VPFFLISALGGAAISYALIESGYVWHAFWLLLIWIVLLWTFPVLSVYFVMLLLALGALMLVISFWEVVAGLALGVVLFLLIVGGLLHAAKADEYMNVPCHAVEECE
jgi:hypothetical protein